MGLRHPYFILLRNDALQLLYSNKVDYITKESKVRKCKFTVEDACRELTVIRARQLELYMSHMIVLVGSMHE